MKIKLSPIAANKTTTFSLNGLTLTVDGIDIDLSQIPVGGQAEGVEPLIGIVTREEVTIQYFYEASLAEPNQSTDINDYIFDVVGGDVPCPIKWKPVVEVDNV